MTGPRHDNLRRALARLAEALARAEAAPQDEVLRDGVIQRFEYSFELGWKALRRHLMEVEALTEAELKHRKDLFRQGERLGLLQDAEAWFALMRARNESSHVYREEVAWQSFEAAQRYLPMGQGLLEAMLRAPGA